MQPFGKRKRWQGAGALVERTPHEGASRYCDAALAEQSHDHSCPWRVAARQACMLGVARSEHPGFRPWCALHHAAFTLAPSPKPGVASFFAVAYAWKLTVSHQVLCAGHVPVAIAGAGPTGLTLAALLSRLQIRCVVLERAPALPTHPQVSAGDPVLLSSWRTMTVARASTVCIGCMLRHDYALRLRGFPTCRRTTSITAAWRCFGAWAATWRLRSSAGARRSTTGAPLCTARASPAGCSAASTTSLCVTPLQSPARHGHAVVRAGVRSITVHQRCVWHVALNCHSPIAVSKCHHHGLCERPPQLL